MLTYETYTNLQTNPVWELQVVQYFWYNISASANSKLKVTVYVSVVQTVNWKWQCM